MTQMCSTFGASPDSGQQRGNPSAIARCLAAGDRCRGEPGNRNSRRARDGRAGGARTSSAELARVQADAERLHETAIAEARRLGEREARGARRRLQRAAEKQQSASAKRPSPKRVPSRNERLEKRWQPISQRVQIEAEQMRETAIAEARAAAEREGRDSLEPSKSPACAPRPSRPLPMR